MKPLLFTLGRNEELAHEVASKLGVDLSDAIITHFEDGESFARPNVDVEGKECIIIHSVARPVNKRLMELLIFLDALHNGGAKHLTVVVPYFGYSRQDRQLVKGDPITGHLVVRLLQAAYADEIVCIDYHSKPLFNKLNIKKTDLTAIPLLASAIKEELKKQGICEDICCISPDKGGIERAKLFAQEFETSTFAHGIKVRDEANHSRLIGFEGDVKGKHCIIVDDICDTAGTLINAIKKVKDDGAKSVYVAVTHGVFSGTAIERLNEVDIDGFFVTNSIENEEFNILKNIKKVSNANIIVNLLKGNFN